MTSTSASAANAGARTADPDAAERDLVLRDGSTVHVRPVRPEDEARLAAFLHDLSEASRRSRFFGVATNDGLTLEARRLSKADGRTAFGLVATTGHDSHIVGHAEYDVLDSERAEASFAVSDRCQGQGLGTILLGELARRASARGVAVFNAVVLPDNYQMLSVFRESGFALRIEAAPREIVVEFPTAMTEQALQRFEQREWTSAVNAMRTFLEPSSVAVVGASRQRGTIGGELLHNLLTFGFNGPVYPVNQNAAVVQSVV
ncbi:MAG: GNAT family N-acetyltransferase, partial [Gemmatimonadaceae bacterium]